ncbi:FecR family protein [Hyphomicrobium sp. 2TAF46]|uniref:FecR family protein n=1 Tax=Hyphomicrobium sp. 2TAF46 TaxID=3233019 RepID=UPI003F8E1844
MKDHRRTDLNPIQDEAVGWVQKLVSGEATPAEIEAAERWRVQSPAHAAAFDAAERVWSEFGAAGRALHGLKGDFASTLDTLGKSRRTLNRRAVLGGGAATVAVASVYGVIDPPLGLWPSLSELNADYRTGTGEQRNVTFANEIAINLNTQTSLAVRTATVAEDRVELVSGEASFATPFRGARSLVVLAANGRTVTESGKFDVRYTTIGERSPVSVTCFGGRVRIEHGADVADLQPGQRVRYDDAGLGQVAAVDPVVASDWQRGIVEFHNTPLTEAVEEINRYRPGRIVLMSKTLGEKQLNGRFRIDQMEKVLLQLEYAFNAKLQRLPGGIVLLS